MLLATGSDAFVGSLEFCREAGFRLAARSTPPQDRDFAKLRFRLRAKFAAALAKPFASPGAMGGCAGETLRRPWPEIPV
jgi:hypothetical protein